MSTPGGVGKIPDAEMGRVFNLGVGFVVVCTRAAADGVIARLAKDGVAAWVIGDVRDGEVGVEWA